MVGWGKLKNGGRSLGYGITGSASVLSLTLSLLTPLPARAEGHLDKFVLSDDEIESRCKGSPNRAACVDAYRSTREKAQEYAAAEQRAQQRIHDLQERQRDCGGGQASQSGCALAAQELAQASQEEHEGLAQAAQSSLAGAKPRRHGKSKLGSDDGEAHHGHHHHHDDDQADEKQAASDEDKDASGDQQEDQQPKPKYGGYHYGYHYGHHYGYQHHHDKNKDDTKPSGDEEVAESDDKGEPTGQASWGSGTGGSAALDPALAKALHQAEAFSNTMAAAAAQNTQLASAQFDQEPTAANAKTAANVAAYTTAGFVPPSTQNAVSNPNAALLAMAAPVTNINAAAYASSSFGAEFDAANARTNVKISGTVDLGNGASFRRSGSGESQMLRGDLAPPASGTPGTAGSTGSEASVNLAGGTIGGIADTTTWITATASPEKRKEFVKQLTDDEEYRAEVTAQLRAALAGGELDAKTANLVRNAITEANDRSAARRDPASASYSPEARARFFAMDPRETRGELSRLLVDQEQDAYLATPTDPLFHRVHEKIRRMVQDGQVKRPLLLQ